MYIVRVCEKDSLWEHSCTKTVARAGAHCSACVCAEQQPSRSCVGRFGHHLHVFIQHRFYVLIQDLTRIIAIIVALALTLITITSRTLHIIASFTLTPPLHRRPRPASTCHSHPGARNREGLLALQQRPLVPWHSLREGTLSRTEMASTSTSLEMVTRAGCDAI